MYLLKYIDVECRYLSIDDVLIDNISMYNNDIFIINGMEYNIVKH